MGAGRRHADGLDRAVVHGHVAPDDLVVDDGGGHPEAHADILTRICLACKQTNVTPRQRSRTARSRPRTADHKAIPSDARQHNRALVLRTLFRQGPLSRADIARTISLTRFTASDLVAELLADGLGRGARHASRSGRRQAGHPARHRPRCLRDRRPRPQRRHPVPRGPGQPRRQGARPAQRRPAGPHRRRRRRPRRPPGARARRRADPAAARRRHRQPRRRRPAGVVVEAPNLAWADVDLGVGRRRAELPCPVHVANDANAAVLGEVTFGASQDPRASCS